MTLLAIRRTVAVTLKQYDVLISDLNPWIQLSLKKRLCARLAGGFASVTGHQRCSTEPESANTEAAHGFYVRIGLE